MRGNAFGFAEIPAIAQLGAFPADP